MGNRRRAQLAMSDEDDDAPIATRRQRRSSPAERRSERKRKKMKLDDLEEEDEDDEELKKAKMESANEYRKRQKKEEVVVEEEEEEEVEEEEEEEEETEAKPIGNVIRVSGKGKGKRNHYASFEYDGNRYDLEDPVLLVPEEEKQKPYVAIIKDITQKGDGAMYVTGQWFYRPEEAQKKGGGNWESSDTRELFYSFHRDEVPAESVMHKCVVHFIPKNKQIPPRKQHPGFFVQKVYDTEQRRLFRLTDKDYEDNKQEEIDLLVQKTMSRLGHLPDIDPEDTAAQQEEQSRNKRLLRKKYMAPLDVSRADEAPTRSGQSLKVETPGTCASNASEYFIILSKFDALTGETQRDRWLEKLLQGVQFVCTPTDEKQSDRKEKGGNDGSDRSSLSKHSESVNGDQSNNLKWPDSAVAPIAALEKVSHEALSLDFQKYNQKMRQLSFNLAQNANLARRLLSGELEPSQVLSMSPNELKEGLTAEEIASRQPEESECMQMTDARCKRCKEKKVGIVEIIHAGHGDRYQLECTACGNCWYAFRDEISALTIDEPTPRSVGTVPLATAKFEDIEKKLVSPRGGDKSADDGLNKSTEA